MIAGTPRFYTYIHRRADDGAVFYVGKGTGNRAHVRRSRSVHWHRIVAKHGFCVEIVARWDSESAAFNHEKDLIAHYRPLGLLCNLTDGGDGFEVGHPVSEETRAKIRAWHIGKPIDAAVRAKISAANKGRVRSEESRAKVSAGLVGRPVSAETRRKISEAQKGRPVSQEKRDRIAATLRGRPLSAEVRKKVSAIVRSQEWRARHSAAMKGRPWSPARREAQESRVKS